MLRPLLAIVAFFILPQFAAAETITLATRPIAEWKAVYGRVEARDRIPARARLGGTLASVLVSEGDKVERGQVLAQIVDAKLGFQLTALQAQRASLDAQLKNAETELQRGEDLLARGTTTVQRLDALRTQVDVVKGQIAALDAQMDVVRQQAAEGTVFAPVSGQILEVPLTQGSVVMPGEAVASIGGGGIFLRLAVPERHAPMLNEGDTLRIEGTVGEIKGKLVRLYPLIENGRVIADVEVADLPDRFVDARVLVRLPVGTREALLVPATALITRAGLDFVATEMAGGTALRTVVPGQRLELDGKQMVEILTGLIPGDMILTEPAAEAGEHD